jgi:2,5-diamino-6-(ribosylamino)-4(3H)-pyrimidinone 5'-phosphate reductase
MTIGGDVDLRLLAVVALWVWSFLVLSTTVLACASPTSISDMTVEEKIQEIMAELRVWQREFDDTDSSSARPFVTAAFAQSLDGYMAAYDGATTTSNYPLSGDESLLLTHALRSMHEGILLGGRTFSIDNPRLTNRLWGAATDDSASQPRPILLDSNLNHVQTLGTNCRLKNPIICCSEEAAFSLESLPFDAQILACQRTSDGKLDIRDVLQQLKLRHGIKSIMVEGGAAVLSSFFEKDLVDALCTTIAPKILHSGITPTFRGSTFKASPVDLTSVSMRFVSLGQDTTLFSRYSRRPQS